MVLELQSQVGPYPRAEFKLDGMRVADVTFVGMNDGLKRVVDAVKRGGVRVTTDDFKPHRGEK